ncbi:PREDICTED: acetyl-CoA acetyltransferase, mitochondrial [Rhagoletis zephyria]|uniref:acetyl-CoA acetyltransferase, mitochondrial n=1 Tax=Rhagoletis zephyria TaxID=28612 RepID=UPI0008112015|nr:PREDICTED: acetyl-CoA acetyltransferase, mitochondrial [Rhagoletis zephyria]
MHTFQRNFMKESRSVVKRCLYDIHCKDLNDVVIASAVRTPITGFTGLHPSLSAPQLGAIAIDAALKHSAVPPEAVQQVYFGNVMTAGTGQAPARQATLLAGLSKRVWCTTVSASSVTGIKSIMFAAQAVKLRLTDAAIAGGMECLSNVPYYMPRTYLYSGDVIMQDGLVADGVTEKPKKGLLKSFGITKEECINYTKESYVRMRRAYRAGLFDLELVPLRIMQTSRLPIIVTEDDMRTLPDTLADQENNERHVVGDGAAALVLTTNEMARRWNLKPLARILGYNESKTNDSDFLVAPAIAVKRMLENINCTKDDISLWELDDSFAAVPLAVMKELELNPEKVNAHGGTMCLGHPIAMSGARLVTHLSHALQPGQIGCAAITNGSGNAAALLLQKISYNCENAEHKLPVLTLYTKDDCTLCEELVKELEIYFDGQFTLEKIDITQKENLRFLRLYRNDIPVLFLNGQFLCMHKLNVNLLGRKMEELRMKRKF